MPSSAFSPSKETRLCDIIPPLPQS
jgi:hypothetical protein